MSDIIYLIASIVIAKSLYVFCATFNELIRQPIYAGGLRFACSPRIKQIGRHIKVRNPPHSRLFSARLHKRTRLRVHLVHHLPAGVVVNRNTVRLLLLGTQYAAYLRSRLGDSLRCRRRDVTRQRDEEDT